MFETVTMVLQTLAGADVVGLPDAELDELVAGAERARSLVEIIEVHALAELERRGSTDRRFGLSTKSWLAHTSGVSPGAAADRVRKANQLRRLPAIDAAVAHGSLTFDHARALANAANPRVADALTELQEEIIALAADSSFTAWQAHVRRLIDLLDQDGPGPDADPDRNRLDFRSGLDGMTDLDGSMTTDVALRVRDVVEAKANELHRRAVRDREQTPDLPVPSRATLRMLALAELIGAAASATGQARAEVTLVLHNHETTDLAGNPVPRAAADVWGCDPGLWAVLVDRMGVPLDLGYARRLASVGLQRAVAVRDRRCVFPGCEQPMAWCDLHHIVPFAQGGRTCLGNLAALCRHHHTVTHRAGWSMRARGDGTFEWTTPSGTIRSTRAADRAPPREAAA